MYVSQPQHKPRPSAPAATSAAPAITPPRRWWQRVHPAPVILAGVAAIAHANLIHLAGNQWGDPSWGTNLVTIALPVAAWAITTPDTLGAHRWLTIWALSYMVQPQYAAITLIVGETWALYRLLVIDRPASLHRLRKLRSTGHDEPVRGLSR